MGPLARGLTHFSPKDGRPSFQKKGKKRHEEKGEQVEDDPRRVKRARPNPLAPKEQHHLYTPKRG